MQEKGSDANPMINITSRWGPETRDTFVWPNFWPRIIPARWPVVTPHDACVASQSFEILCHTNQRSLNTPGISIVWEVLHFIDQPCSPYTRRTHRPREKLARWRQRRPAPESVSPWSSPLFNPNDRLPLLPVGFNIGPGCLDLAEGISSVLCLTH